MANISKLNGYDIKDAVAREYSTNTRNGVIKYDVGGLEITADIAIQPTYNANRKNVINLATLQNVLDTSIYANLQGACYNSNTGHVIFSFTNGQSTGRLTTLVELSPDMSTVYNAVIGLDLGHANSLDYIPDENVILCAPGNEGSYANKLIVLNADTYAVKNIIDINGVAWYVGYDRANNVIYYGSSTYINVMDRSYNTVYTVPITPLTSYVSGTTLQGCVVVNGNCLVIYSSNYGSYLVQYNLENGNTVDYAVINNGATWNEAEDGFVIGETLYVAHGQKQFMCITTNINGAISDRCNDIFGAGWPIYENEDLNSARFCQPGKYYSPSGTITGTIANKPTSATGGFTLLVFNLAFNHICQILIVNNSRIWERSNYGDVALNTAWTQPWYEINRTSE